MFWIFFDTATKRDYYKDVHNLLALPVDNIITYDYRPRHISDQALARADSHDSRPEKALIVYAQSGSYAKGTASPPDENPLSLEDSLWVATRLARVEHVTRRGDRYYFDLKLAGFPIASGDHLATIISSLAEASEIPFNKFIALSELDDQLAALKGDDDHESWAGVVDMLGAAPSQFAGDTFWRILNVKTGQYLLSPIVPIVCDPKPIPSGQGDNFSKRAVYSILERDKLSIQIETRTVQPADEPEHPVTRAISFHAAKDGPLSPFDGKSIAARRYSRETVDIEVGATLRTSGQDMDLRIETGQESNSYAAGPDLELHFNVENGRLRVLFAALGILGTVACLTGTGLVSTNLEAGVALIGFGVVAGFVSGCLLTGRIPLPGSS